MNGVTALEFVGGRQKTNNESLVRKFEGYKILVGNLLGIMILGPHKEPRKLFPCGVSTYVGSARRDTFKGGGST